MKRIVTSKSASRGIVVQKVFKYVQPNLTPETREIFEMEIDAEIEKFEKAKAEVLEELNVLAEINEIFFAHSEIANDFTLSEGIISKIKSQNKNVQIAVYETIDEIASMFSMFDDPYMKERSADVKDVGKRYMSKLKGVILRDLGEIKEKVIVVANDLYPSDTVKIDTNYVKGIITEEGGITSHVFIIAKSMDIPILVGVKDFLKEVSEGELVCMDAKTGEVVIRPTEETKKEFEDKREEFISNKLRIETLRNREIISKDGKKIILCSNVGNIKDIKNAEKYNLHGVGLFRTEFLYMENSRFPTEEEQFNVYKDAAILAYQELTIRTLDIGGDKELSYFDFPKEENPFLGWRAIRICTEMKDMFKTQLRAILRASVFGNVRIMIPMVISVKEIREVRETLEECKKELETENIEYNNEIKIGIMIETPASVLIANELAKEVDFFSIGTNDLTQYLLAVDRGNKKVAELYDYFHPAVLNAIKMVIDAGHNAGILVGMCGEMAGDTKAAKILLEMGLDEFSMSASSADYIREELLN